MELRGEGGMGTRAGDLPRRAPTYLPVDVDAAGSKGGGAVAGHVVVNGWLRQGHLRVRGHCGDTGGDRQLLGNSAPINPATELFNPKDKQGAPLVTGQWVAAALGSEREEKLLRFGRRGTCFQARWAVGRGSTAGVPRPGCHSHHRRGGQGLPMG